MNSLSNYQAKREALKQKYLGENASLPTANGPGTGGVDHLAMISSDIERTIEFYTGILGMTVTRIVHLWSAGMAYQGASGREVAARVSW